MFISTLVALLPIKGLSAGDYILSINPNFSIGSVTFLSILFWKQINGRNPLSKINILFFSLWNLAVSLPLYSSALGFITFDLYALGYSFSIWFIITAILTTILIAFKSPLSFIFIAYIVAFDLKFLPSNNFFDYITDGLVTLISSFIVLQYAFNYLGKRRGYYEA